MRNSSRRRFWIRLTLAGLPALLIVDALLGIVYRTNTNAEVTIVGPRSGSTHRAIVIFPGYVMPGATLGSAFAPHVLPNDALIVVNYAERGVNASQIYEHVMAALGTLQPAELRVYGASMGGMLSKLFLDRYRQAGAPYGKVVLILDSAPATARDVRRPRFLLETSCWYRGGPLVSVLWAVASQLGPKPPIEDDASPDLVRAAHHAGAWVGMPAATSQACFIDRFGPRIGDDLRDVAQQVIYLQGDSLDDDPLVRTSSAIVGWRVVFPNLIVKTVRGRAGRWHLPLVEFPRATVGAMIGAY